MLDKSEFTEAQWLEKGFELQSKAEDTKKHYETRLVAMRRLNLLISLGVLLLSVGGFLTFVLGPVFISIAITAMGGVISSLSTVAAIENARETGTSHYWGSARHKADQAQRELSAYYMADSLAVEFKSPKAAIERDDSEADKLRRINNTLVEKNAALTAKIDSLRGRIISDQKNSDLPRQLNWQELEDITDGFGNTIAVRGGGQKRSTMACNKCEKFMSGVSKEAMREWARSHYSITGHSGYTFKD